MLQAVALLKSGTGKVLWRVLQEAEAAREATRPARALC